MYRIFTGYYEANIPVDYWFRDMDEWRGTVELKKYYDLVTSNIKESFSDGRKAMFAGMHGTGKQISLDTDIPTINGFVKLRDLKEGDFLFDEMGCVCKVTKLHPINKSPESFSVVFDDYAVSACADHLWEIFFEDESRCIKNTKEIIKDLENKRVFVRYAEPPKYDKKLSINSFESFLSYLDGLC